jgi:ATP-dependent Clp protease ATP-binding subunit ClpB
MTSNIGSADLIEQVRSDGTIAPETKEKVEGQLRNYFRPEFLNRIDDIVVFSPLTEDQIVQIITMSLRGLEQRLAEREIKLELTDAGRKFIADEAYDPAYGARPVKRYLQKNVETALASALIKGDVVDGDTVVIDTDGTGLTFTTK